METVTKVRGKRRSTQKPKAKPKVYSFKRKPERKKKLPTEKSKKEYFKESEVTVITEPVPENDEEYEACNRNPITHDCPKCLYVAVCDSEYNLTLTSNIPKRVIDIYWHILRQNEKDILIFLADRANFARDSTQFGVAYATKQQINARTGVPTSNMYIYIKELVKHGLITKYVSDPKLDKATKSWYKNTQFIVTWFIKLQDIKVEIKRIETESKKTKGKS